MDDADVARAYYRAIDDGAYDELAALLVPGFVQVRPDRTLEGRDRFVRFMRDERPMTDTEHAVDGVYRGEDGVAVRGQLLRGDRSLFEFVDTFAVEAGRITAIRTYTR